MADRIGGQRGVFMNFVFISPNFPTNYWHFCEQLKNNGVNVLGIGDSPYDSLSYSLRDTLTEYYRVDSMENYDQMVRAVAYFTFKYGKIDWLESNNEYWLEQDAKLRTDFHITTGCDYDQIKKWQSKSSMKEYYRQARVPVVECHHVQDREGCLEFMSRYEYPFIVKPDSGVGASRTWRLRSLNEFDYFYETRPKDVPFILEPFIDGTICSYDAVINSKGEPLFESGNVTPVSIMDCVNNQSDAYFYIEKQLPDDVTDIGRRCVASFGVKSRFVHMEFFRLNRDMQGIGSAGTIVGLEVNMRPSGGFTPDMLNYANSTNVYKIWADMVVFDSRRIMRRPDRYYCIYIGRRDGRKYIHSHSEVLSKYRADITMSDRMPDVLASAMGNQMYIAKFEEKEKMDEFIKYVLS